ncbi:hypothetical protein JAAARDRAFT_30827 [Jaapia argillacea MUCL 33604]|uniref:Uncharacterized protein n=1 Tax=Jaapia argillacea MUCL 33604 TaxID=933084 RepID=A0A067QD11_9AGAM|nr:hypothetical protein JAAARDRAFT_30827 [Jaapia argillacea MUCL 33604]
MAKFGPAHFLAPAAAFTMAITVVFYVRYTIRTTRLEAQVRREEELERTHAVNSKMS